MQSWSFWEKQAFDNSDIAIVGAGIVGLFTSLYLKKKFPSKKIMVLDRHSMAAGASTKNAGFVCFGSVSEIQDDLKSMNKKEVIDLIRMRWEGLKRLRSVLNDRHIEYINFGAYEVFDTDDDYGQYASQLDFFNEMVEEACELRNCFQPICAKLSDSLSKNQIYNQYEGQLNPVLLIAELRKMLIQLDVIFLQGAELEDWESGDRIKIQLKDKPAIHTRQIVFATNAFTKRFFPDIPLTPYRNQVLITEKINGLAIKGCFHYNKGYTYFRNVGSRVLIGGFRNIDLENEQTDSFGLTDNIQGALESFISDKLQLKSIIEHRWSGILATGPKKSAIVKKVDDNVFIGVRLGGMGVAIGSLVGFQLSELID